MENIDQNLKNVHQHLMYLKFPYHSISVIHRKQDLRPHVIFMSYVEKFITDDLKGYLEAGGFTYSIVKGKPCNIKTENQLWLLKNKSL